MGSFFTIILTFLLWLPKPAACQNNDNLVSLIASHYYSIDETAGPTFVTFDPLRANPYSAQGLLLASNTSSYFHFILSASTLEPFLFTLPTYQAAHQNELYRIQAYIKHDDHWERLQAVDDVQASFQISPNSKELEILCIFRVGSIPILNKVAPVFLSESTYLRQKQPKAFFIGGSMGILFGMILFNLLGYLIHRQRHQLYYSAYLISGFYWLAFATGILPSQTETFLGLTIIAGSGSLFLVLFTFASLTTSESYRKLFQIGLFVGGLNGFFQILSLLGIGQFIFGIYAVPPICGSICIIVCLKAALTQRGPAISMLIGYIILFLSINAFILSQLFLKEWPDLNWLILLGFCLETILFSLAVAQKTKLIEKNIMERNQILQQKLLEEQAAGLNVQRLETNLRLQLAASIAHRVNNPLNAIQLSADSVKLNLQGLINFVQALVGEEPSSDPEVRACQDQLCDLTKEIHKPLDLLASGLSRAQYSVREIRALSGLDGGCNQLISCQELWNSLMTGLQEADSARLKKYRFLQNDFQIFGDISLLRTSLEILFHAITRDVMQGDIIISATAWDGQAWYCEIKTNLALDLAMWTAIERSMQGILKASSMSCKVHYNNEKIEVSFFEQRDRISGDVV